MNFTVVLPVTFRQHFLQHRLFGYGKKGLKFCRIIWFAIVWEIWIHRNGIIFKNECKDPTKVMEVVKLKTWVWLKNYHTNFSYSFFEWCNEPMKCLYDL